jgi:hypothetical protein
MRLRRALQFAPINQTQRDAGPQLFPIHPLRRRPDEQHINAAGGNQHEYDAEDYQSSPRHARASSASALFSSCDLKKLCGGPSENFRISGERFCHHSWKRSPAEGGHFSSSIGRRQGRGMAVKSLPDDCGVTTNFAILQFPPTIAEVDASATAPVGRF